MSYVRCITVDIYLGFHFFFLNESKFHVEKLMSCVIKDPCSFLQHVRLIDGMIILYPKQ